MHPPAADRPAAGRLRWWLVLLALLPAIGSDSAPEPGRRDGPAPTTLLDPRLAPLRDAAARWAARPGPTRAVVDQVCLVPDLATFCAAVAEWDRGHCYPILIEDAESSPRFLRAFRPARVVRRPRALPPPPGGVWPAALAAVRSSWREESDVATVPASPDPADPAQPPATLGPTPPGVVLSSPDAPMLGAAIALAAGRFQALARLDPPAADRGAATWAEFGRFDRAVVAAVARAAPAHLGLGDDCDFLTLAGRYPYRYKDAKGEDEAVDDAIGRTATGSRWAYVGRIVGDPAASVYAAMCALFLRPEAAAWISGYDDSASPWAEYSARAPAMQLARVLPGEVRDARDRSAGIAGWHEAFHPENRAGFVWVNSHGTPTRFHLQGNEPASTCDVPRTVPCTIVMVHSFSAADPTDPATIAGRWLANGAFLYYGSMNEPYLQAFRTPQLVADLAGAGLPLVAALRQTPVERFGHPWRLAYLGDPLYRAVAPPPRPRVAPGDLPAGWALLVAPEAGRDHPPRHADPATVVRDGRDAALALAASPLTTPTDGGVAALIDRLGDVDRDALNAADRRALDSTLADLLFFARRRTELRLRAESIPPAGRSPELARWLDAVHAVDLAWLAAGGDFDRTRTAWWRIIHSETSRECRELATARVGKLADDPARRVEWAAALRAALGPGPPRPEQKYLADELERVKATAPGTP